MSAWHITLLVAVIVVTDLMIVGAVLSSVGGSLRKLAAQYPPSPPLPGAVRREFQSMRIDMCNLGYSVHIEVDERCVHLYPSATMRLLKLPGASIPWGAFSNVKPKGKHYATAHLAGADVMLPLWAMQAGFPDLGSDSR